MFVLIGQLLYFICINKYKNNEDKIGRNTYIRVRLMAYFKNLKTMYLYYLKSFVQLFLVGRQSWALSILSN